MIVLRARYIRFTELEVLDLLDGIDSKVYHKQN
jgi:hypothetical protein